MTLCAILRHFWIYLCTLGWIKCIRGVFLLNKQNFPLFLRILPGDFGRVSPSTVTYEDEVECAGTRMWTWDLSILLPGNDPSSIELSRLRHLSSNTQTASILGWISTEKDWIKIRQNQLFSSKRDYKSQTISTQPQTGLMNFPNFFRIFSKYEITMIFESYLRECTCINVKKKKSHQCPQCFSHKTKL
jgi:hypothetical protein